MLAEGCWGHLTGAAIKEFDLGDGREPQVWELGVKEVWKVKKPLDRVIHTFVQPWPLKVAAKYGQLGGTWMYPMKDEKTGDDLVSIGFVVDLNYRDATTSAHDLLQQFKLHPLVKGILEGGERVAWGAKALPGRRLLVDAQADDAGRAARRRRRRDGRRRRAQGRAPLHQVGHPRRRGDLPVAEVGHPLETYEQAVEDSSIGQELYQVRNTRQAVPEGLPRRQPARGPVDHVQGQGPAGPAAVASRRRGAAVRRRHQRAAIPSPTANTRSTSSARSTSRATRPATTHPTTSACAATSRARSPRGGAGCARRGSTRSPTTHRRAMST